MTQEEVEEIKNLGDRGRFIIIHRKTGKRESFEVRENGKAFQYSIPVTPAPGMDAKMESNPYRTLAIAQTAIEWCLEARVEYTEEIRYLDRFGVPLSVKADTKKDTKYDLPRTEPTPPARNLILDGALALLPGVILLGAMWIYTII